MLPEGGEGESGSLAPPAPRVRAPTLAAPQGVAVGTDFIDEPVIAFAAEGLLGPT